MTSILIPSKELTQDDDEEEEEEEEKEQEEDEDGESFTKEVEGLEGKTPLAKRRRLEE